MVFSERGIEIARWSDSIANYPALDERISSGIERLDHMLDGGYYRGSSVLITGAPGTAKTTLGGKFLEAACTHGEPSMMVSFDESPGAVVRNLSSVGSQLEQYLNSSLLTIHSVRSDAYSAEEHLVQIRHLIEAHQPRNLVIDPISAMLKAGGEIPALAFARHLLHLTRSRGITLLITSLLGTSNPQVEATRIEISTIADTWIHLSYVVQAGERNRSLTIVKSRGTAHSNQVRELLLSDQGVTLEEVYSAGGEVLMGTLRWEKENAILQEKEQVKLDVERKRREIELLEAETQARIEALHQELDSHRAELTALPNEQEQREQIWKRQREATLRQREGGARQDEPLSENNQ
jgi:circadian clock protein KaiC